MKPKPRELNFVHSVLFDLLNLLVTIEPFVAIGTIVAIGIFVAIGTFVAIRT